MRATSPSSFTRAALDRPSVGTSSALGEPLPANGAAGGPVTRGRLQPEAGDAGLLRRAARACCAGHRRGDLEGLDAGGGQLLAGLLAVATVGHEEQAVGQHEQHRGRAGEAGQVADVDEAGDEEGVAALGRRSVRPPGRPATSIGGAGAVTAVWPVTRAAWRRPRPPAVAVAAEARRSSRWRPGDHARCGATPRALGLERCSSTIGPSKAARASWSAQA